jgi:hypothetical protein
MTGHDFGPKTYVFTCAQGLGRRIIRVDGEKQEIIEKNYDGTVKGSPNINLIEGLEHYCKLRDGELSILTMKGRDSAQYDLHPFFDDRNDLCWPAQRGKRLNDKLELSDDTVPPQNVDPSTGRERFAQRDHSIIYPHAKQRLKPVQKSNSKLPRLIITPGCCTYPNYNEDSHRGNAARKDHMYGAVIVEIINRKTYNLRHIKAHKDGKFVDMGKKYDGNKRPEKIKTDALILGDIHWGDHDPETIKANYEMIDFFKPKRLFLHDFLNGHSINPHERQNIITRIKNYDAGRLSIEEELKACNKELCRLGKRMKNGEINLVASNHPFFLDRYLESGGFVHEPWNAKIAFKLADLMCKGKDPGEEGIRMMGKLPDNIHFMRLEDDYKVWGWQLASHGHKGLSGARGSVRSRELSHGKSITGHTHSPEILRETIIVGTSTRLNLDYTQGGASSWLPANAVIYDGGFVQLIPIILGKWRKKKYKTPRPKDLPLI